MSTKTNRNANGIITSTKNYQEQTKAVGELVKTTQTLDKSGGLKSSSNETVVNLSKQKDLLNQIANFQLKTNQQIALLESGKTSGSINTVALDKVKTQLNALALDTPNLIHNMKQIPISLDGITKSAKQTAEAITPINEKTDSLGTTMIKSASKFAIWMGIATAFMSVVNAIKNGIGYVVELNNQLTKLRIEMNLTDSDMKKMTSSAQSMAKELGSTVSDVLKIAEVYSNVNETVDSIIEKTRAAIVMGNLSGMTPKDASDAIQGIALQFSILDKDSMHITDIITKTAAAIGVDFGNAVQVISDAIKVSGNVATEAGIKLENYAAIVGSISQITRLPGSTIGQSMKTIITRTQRVTSDETSMEDISKAETALRSVGVEVRKSETEFKNFDETMGELSKKWETMTMTSKSYIAYQLSGIRQVNIFDAMMKEWSKSTAMATDNLNSQGFAMEKNDIYLQSNEAKMKLLTSATETFWQNAVDSDVINGAVVALTKLVETFDFLINNPIASFLITVAASTGALKLLGLGFTALGKSTIGTSIGLWAIQASEEGLIVTTKALTATMLASPLFWIVAITAGIYLFVKAVDFLNVTFEEQKAKVAELSTEYDALKKSLTGLQDELTKTQARIDELSNKNPITLVEQDELDKLRLVNKELQVKVDLMKIETNNKAETLGNENVNLYNKKFGSETTSNSKISEYQNAPLLVEPIAGFQGLNVMIAAYNSYKIAKDKALNSGDLKGVERFNDLMKETEKSLLISSNDLIAIRENLQALPNPTEKQKKIIDEINNSLKFTRSILLPDQLFGEAWKQLTKQEQEYLNTANKNGTLTEEQVKKYQALNDILGINGFSFEKLKGYIEKATTATETQTTALENTAKILYKFPSDLKTVEDAFTATADSIKLLASAQDDLKTSHEISSDTLQNLIEKYPQLIAYLSNETEMSKQISGILEIEKENQRLNFEAKLTYSNAYFNSLIKGNADTWNIVKNAYSADYENFHSVADAKLSTNNWLVKMIGASWSQMYSSQEAALRAVINNLQATANSSNIGLMLDAQRQLDALKAMSEPMKIASQKIPFVSIPKSSSSSPSSSSQTDPTKFDLNLDRYMSFNNILAQINNELELNNSLQDSASDSDKIKLLEQRNILLAQQQNALHSLNEERKTERDELARGIKSNGIGIDTNGNVTNADAILQSMTNSANRMAEGNAKKAKFDNIKNLQDDVKRYADLVTSEIPKTYQEWIDSANAISKNAIAIKDLANQLETDTLSKMKDLRKQQYEEEKTAFDDLIDHKIKRLDDLQAKEDYDKNINKQDIAIAKKQSEINALYGDNSFAGIKKKAEFETQLLDLKTARQDTATQHNIDAQKIALQKQKDNSDSYFDEKLKDANLQAQVEIELATKGVNELKTIYGTLWDSFNDSISKLGQSLKVEFIDRLIEAKKLSDSALSSPYVSPSTPVTTSPPPTSQSTPTQAPSSRTYTVKKDDNLWDIAKETLGNSLRYMEIYNLNRDKLNNPRLIYPGQILKIPRFLSGGYTGDSEGLGWLDKKEIILNSIDTSNLLKAVNITRQIVGNLNVNRVPNISNNSTQGDITLNQTNYITTQKGQSEEDVAKMVWKYTANELNKRGR